jgi:hypothetical protein
MLKSNEYSTKYLYVSTHGEVCLKSGKTSNKIQLDDLHRASAQR